MAQDLDDGEFWLPSQFLTDDDILMDFKSDLIGGGGVNNNAVSGFGFFGPTYSGDTSPVESVVSSTETESDEEYYIAGLTQKMGNSSLRDDLWKEDSALGYETQKSLAISGSPQSTLCGVSGGCGCKQSSSRGSPNCPSPPVTELNRNDSAWDLLYAAAGEVARMRIVEDNNNNNGLYQNRGLLAPPPPRKPSPVSVPLKNPNPNQNISYQQLQLAQFQQLKQQQMMKQQAIWTQSKAASGNYHHQQHPSQTPQVVGQNRGRNNNGRPLGLSPAAWPTLQQSQQQQQQQPPPGSGMRAVFLGHNNGSKRECAGTGVFLPRGVGNQTETRKKPGCATVLLPDRVVQALNLNLEAMESHHPRFKPNFTTDHDAALKFRNNAFMAQQKRNLRSPAGISQDHRLPSEWTY